MLYSDFAEVYERLSGTSKRLEKISILAEFLKKIGKSGKSKWTYLLFGRVIPDYDAREFGISRQLAIKAIAGSLGLSEKEIIKQFNKIGDLGEIAEQLIGKRKQAVLFSKRLDVDKVFDNLSKLMSIEGKGSVDKKMQLIAELLGQADGREAKYIVRTLLSDLRIGVAEGVLREALAEAFFDNPKEVIEKIEEAHDLVNDFSEVFDAALKGVKGLEEIEIVPGRPIKAMLAVKVKDIDEGFDVCGKPAAFEHKYDGFRMFINKRHGEYWLFTRKLENVTNQFPDVIDAIKKYVKGDSFILDAEIVGYDKKTKKYMPFEAISQRIRRKYDIEKVMKDLPVEVNVFDVVYYNGERWMDKIFSDRRKLVEKIVLQKDFVIRPSRILITDDGEEAQKFYEEALEIGEEGVMIKNLNAMYKQGRRVGFMAKLKPDVKDIDLVIVGAEYGSGKRAGWLTSYRVACKSGEHFLEIGNVSSGLKEKSEEGMSYEEMTKLLKPLILSQEGTSVKIKPKVVVSVTYQNIQKSPSYNSGYAMRFPRITNYRPDRSTNDILTLKEVEKLVENA